MILSWRRLYAGFFPVCLKLLGIEEGEKHTFFLVLKSILYLAKNIFQNIAVELVVVCAKVSLGWAFPSALSTLNVWSGLVDLT